MIIPRRRTTEAGVGSLVMSMRPTGGGDLAGEEGCFVHLARGPGGEGGERFF